jgi:hypothetical protein
MNPNSSYLQQQLRIGKKNFVMDKDIPANTTCTGSRKIIAAGRAGIRPHFRSSDPKRRIRCPVALPAKLALSSSKCPALAGTHQKACEADRLPLGGVNYDTFKM